MDTKIWIQTGQGQQGPFTLEQLAAMNIDPRTPVWHEGLSDWTLACNSPLVSRIFSGPFAQSAFTSSAPAGSASSASFAARPGGYTAPGQLPCPPTYMAWAIFATICCCLPLGIVSIIYSSQVNSRYYSGDYAGAFRASERAQLWLIIAIVIGIISAPFAFLAGRLGSLFFWL